MIGDYPQVSVITLTFRHFDTIFKTMDSVFAQDYPNIQYIICDDGSENFPAMDINEYFKNSKANITKVIHHSEKNNGTVRNINTAYKLATGMFVMNLSAGDVFFDNSVVTKVVETFMSKQCEVLVTSRVLFTDDFQPICLLPHYSDRKRIAKWDTPEKQRCAFVTSSFLDMASGSAMYFDRKAIQEFGYFDEKYILWEDGPFINKYLMKKKIECAYEITSTWYEIGGVSTGTGSKNPLLLADEVKFNAEDRILGTDNYSTWNKLKLRYRSLSLTCESKKKRIMLRLRYLPVFVYFGIQNTRSKMLVRKDRKVMQQFIQNKKEEER